MKKVFQLLAALFLFGNSALALAYSDKATVIEGAGLVQVERLAVAAPLYMPVNGSPSLEELVRLLNEAAVVSKHQVVTYDVMAQYILRDRQVDLYQTDRHVGAKVFRDQAAQYADAYVLLTVANNSRTVFFFDVYKAGTNELLYSYQIIADRDDPDDVKTYTMMAQKFYKNFDWSAEEEKNRQEKEAKEAQAKAKKEAQRAAKEQQKK
ncbi:MAG: coenzyme F(420) biosynthesis enzyme [Schwartzia sp. (in: firmicutes)]